MVTNMSSATVTKMVTTEMHTGGQPLRIVEDGCPNLEGETILDKRRYARDKIDHLRKLLIFEPRGHFDMYGILLVSPDLPGADVGAIFMHNEGYSSMCGDAVISLGRYVIDKQIIKNPKSPETKVGIQCPCGLVEAFVEYDNTTGKTGAVRFHSVPAFVYATDVTVSVEGFGNITVDIAYGGTFYALVPAKSYGYSLDSTPVQKLRGAAGSTTDELRKRIKLEHPESQDLAFVYGTILTDGEDAFSESPTASMCVFAEKEVDRSPCGSGVTARIAQQVHRGHIKLRQKRTFVGPAKSQFIAQAVKEVTYGKYDHAVVVEVSGKGYYTGSAVYTAEDDDEIGKGFLLC